MNFQFLESEGAKMAVILFMLVYLSILAFILHETRHDPGETGRVLLSNAFTSLMTLLLAKLGDKPKAS